MPRKLTPKQAKLARELLKNPEATLEELGQIVGYSDAAHVHSELEKEHVKDRVKDLMDASPKLRVPALLAKLEEGLDAQEIKFFADKGEVISERVTVDFPTRLGYLDRALDLQGLKQKDKEGSSVTMTKDVFVELCATFWATKPNDGQR